MGFLKNLFSSPKEGSISEEEKKKEKNFDILKFDGMRAMQIGQFAYAERCFKEALLLKDDFETMTHLANTYIRKNELAEAQELLKGMCDIEPTNLTTFLTLANVYYMQEDYNNMVETLHQAHQLDTQNATIQFLFAKANKGLNNNVEVITTLTRAIQIKEDFIEAHIMRAETLINMHCFKEADEDIAYCLHRDPNNEEVLLLKAESEYATGKFNEAEQSYIQVVEADPFNEKAYLKLNKLYLEQKELDKAISKMDEAIEINPNFAEAYKQRGEAKLLKGDKEGSVEDLKKALELNPESEKEVTGEYHSFDDLYKNNPL